MKTKHPFKVVMSVTTLKLNWDQRDVATVVVYREEVEVDDWELRNVELYETVRKFHQTCFREIAKALMDLPRVRRVTITTDTGNGIHIED